MRLTAEEEKMSDAYESLSHSQWDCKYHVMFVPKRRREVLFGQVSSSSGRSLPCSGPAEGVPDSRRASAAGPTGRPAFPWPEW